MAPTWAGPGLFILNFKVSVYDPDMKFVLMKSPILDKFLFFSVTKNG